MAEQKIEANSIWSYKGRQYQVNSLLLRNLIQDPELGCWRPTVRYTCYPNKDGLVFYRADTEFSRKFEFVE